MALPWVDCGLQGQSQTKGPDILQALVHGFLTSLSLILAIGAQNAFVLRQGIRREHVSTVVLVCALSDVVLIAAGVAGFGVVTAALPWLVGAMRWLGVAFLLVYGGLRFRAALQGGEALRPAAGGAVPLGKVLATCLLLTWANPHVYLDTMVLLGSISTHYAPVQLWFGIGAAAASFVFFGALGFGARALAPLFERPAAWVVLEVVVGLTMWAIASVLAMG
ncbi:MAG: amino acid transporter [Rhodoferax sp.]|nr:amino acid transporter [Rhodoferax sp.]